MNSMTNKALTSKIQKGKACLDYMKEQSKDAFKANEKLLLKLIDENKATVYGKKYDFESIHSAEDYMKQVPLTVYEDYEGYIEQIVQGQGNPLSVRPVNHFAKSSGSAGNPKKVPMCLEGTDMFTDYTLNVCFASMDKALGDSWVKTRGVSLADVRFEEINGITYGPISGKVREKFRDVEHYVYTSPKCATFPSGETDTKYLHLRYALMEADLSFMTCSFLNLAVDTMAYLQRHWQVIVKDIAEGLIDENIHISKADREILLKDLQPMPHRAAELKREFEKGFTGILPRIWNNFKFVYGIGGGGFRVYKDKMRKYLGGVPLHLGIYSASEGIFATHITPESQDMALILDSAFYEFIPVDDETETPVTIDKVTLGQDYEIVITNLSGFYRYRIGDVVRITGFMETCPMIRFLYRKNQMVDVAGEKTNDDCMNQAIAAFSQRADFDLVEYSLYGDYTHTPGRYIIFVEGENFRGTRDICTMARILDEEIGVANPSYADKRKRGIISPLKLYFLRGNSFGVYRQLMIAKGAAVTQLKPVRMIDNPFREKFFFSMIEENPFKER